MRHLAGSSSRHLDSKAQLSRGGTQAQGGQGQLIWFDSREGSLIIPWKSGRIPGSIKQGYEDPGPGPLELSPFLEPTALMLSPGYSHTPSVGHSGMEWPWCEADISASYFSCSGLVVRCIKHQII